MLIGLLNDIFQGRKVVIDLKYGPTEHSSDFSKDRGVTVDLFCTGDKGEQFIVEMQRASQEYFKDRSLFYTSRVISRQEQKGQKDWDYKLKEVYFIGILDFKFSQTEETKYFYDVRLTEWETGHEFYDKLGFVYIELPNFVKQFPEDTNIEEIPILDRWIYTLKYLSKLDKPPKFLNEWIFKRLFKIAEIGNLNKEERMLYESSLKARRDYNNSIAFAEKKAKERGIEKGREEVKIEMIKNLITQLGLSDEQAASVAEVPVAFVEQIRKELKK